MGRDPHCARCCTDIEQTANPCPREINPRLTLPGISLVQLALATARDGTLGDRDLGSDPAWQLLGSVTGQDPRAGGKDKEQVC